MSELENKVNEPEETAAEPEVKSAETEDKAAEPAETPAAETPAEEVSEAVEETAEAIKDATEQAAENIEKTVEDLRRKIKEISSDEEKGSGEPTPSVDFGLNEEQKAKIEEIRENTMKSVNETISEVKKKADEFTANPDVKKTIDFLKANAIKAVDTARAKIDEIREKPEVKRTIDNAEDAMKGFEGSAKKTFEGAEEKAKEFSESAKKTVDGFLTEEKMEEIRKGIEKAEGAVNTTVDNATKAINEFVNKPEVQETIDKTVSTAKEMAEKGVSAINSMFKKDTEE
jgi:hypothetical protein